MTRWPYAIVSIRPSGVRYIHASRKFCAYANPWAPVIEASFSEASDREVRSTEIGERVMRYLRDLDDVAYVRFASVYRSFKDINEFMSELKDILDRRDDTKK